MDWELSKNIKLWQQPWVENFSWWVTGIANIFFFICTLWEIKGPLPGGHLGNAAGAAIAGENMCRWHLFAAVTQYTCSKPLESQYYAHHPYMVFFLEALSYQGLGHSWVTVRIPALLCSSLTPLLVYLTCRALWGALPACLATLMFVLIPINLAFSSFANLEVEAIFLGLLFSWAITRLWQTWKNRYIVWAVVGALGVCNSDWIGFVLVGVAATFAFVRAYVLSTSSWSYIEHKQHARWFGYIVAILGSTLVFYILLFAKQGKLDDLLISYQFRSSGSDASLSTIFSKRRVMWVLLMLPKITLWSIGLGMPLGVLRLIVLRRFEEIVPLIWLVAASFQYFVFKQGADVHIFWPHYYGLVAPFGLAYIAASFFSAICFMKNVLPVNIQDWFERVALSFGLMGALMGLFLLGRVGLVQLYQSHLTGGRFDDGGRYIAVDQDRSQFASWVSLGLPFNAIVTLLPSFFHTWNVEYGVHRPIEEQATLATLMEAADIRRIALLDARFTSPAELRSIAHRFSVQAVGPFWKVDRALPGGILALRYIELQPKGLNWYFVTGSDLYRVINSNVDPWQTWQWRDHLGLAGDPPSSIPSTADESRIAYNAAIAYGHTGLANTFRGRAETLVRTKINVDFTNDIHLLGIDVDEGSATVMTLLWETGPAFQPADLDFLVRSEILRPPPLWISVTDYFEKEIAPPQALRPGLWKAGYLYMQKFVIMRRVGVEHFYGFWIARGATTPHPTNGAEKVDLLTLH